MKAVAKSLAYASASAVMHPALVARFHDGPLTILMYHGVVNAPLEVPDPCMVQLDDFQSQMRYLKRHFDVLPLREAMQRRLSRNIDRPTIVITFDDGYQNNCDIALPILEELQLPATIYLATGFLSTDSTIWTGQLQHAFAATQLKQLTWHGETWDTSSIRPRIEDFRSQSCQNDNVYICGWQ